MPSDFLHSKPDKAKHQIVEILYERLREVRQASVGKTFTHDEFDQGVNYRLYCEAEWLEDLLDKIERS